MMAKAIIVRVKYEMISQPVGIANPDLLLSHFYKAKISEHMCH